MSQIAKQGMSILAAVALAAISLVALLLTLQANSPSQAASSVSIADSRSTSSSILPEDGTYLGVVISPLERLDAFNCMVGKKHKVIKIYQHFHNGVFYTDFADFIHGRGALEFLSFDPAIHVHQSPGITESLDLTPCAIHYLRAANP
jgi:hypothetical protein